MESARFLKLQVKKQNYLGKPSLGIYVNDYSKKIKEKFTHMQLQEQHVRNTQAESYSSVISHEMRAPLLNIMFFLNQVMRIIKLQLTEDNSVKKELKHYCSLMINQLNFVLSFVEDLLDLQQLKSGNLQLAHNIFDPVEVFDLIFKIFEPQSRVQNTRLIFKSKKSKDALMSKEAKEHNHDA